MTVKIKLFNAAIILAVSLVIPAAFSTVASAATSESCFAFNASTGTILDYGDEIIDTDNPNGHGSREIGDCPTDVDIPARIGGVDVEIIGYGAFGVNGLTSVVIPDSVVTIGDVAFYTNSLKSVTIGSNVETIGWNAFASNKLSSVNIPNSVTSIGISAFTGNRPEYSYMDMVGKMGEIEQKVEDGTMTQEEADAAMQQLLQEFINEVIYVRLYTADPSNPNNLEDFSFISDDGGGMYNGGHLINPAQVTVNYADTAGKELAPSVTMTGVGLSSYKLSENDTNDLSRYFRIGATQQFTAPQISGYSIITPNSPYTYTLANAINTVNFTYSNPTPANPNNPTTPANPNTPTNANLQNVPRAPDSGVAKNNTNLVPVLAISSTLLALAGVTLGALRKS